MSYSLAANWLDCIQSIGCKKTMTWMPKPRFTIGGIDAPSDTRSYHTICIPETRRRT